ncbi:MAG: acyl-CoA dehydrogenase family protein [Pseudomonadota bacterium]
MQVSHPLIDAAQGLQAELRERSQEIDDARQIPQDLADRMAVMGLYRMITPSAFGGLDVGPIVLCRVCELLAQANGSVGWCIFIGATSQYLFGAVPDQLLKEMLAQDNLITSGVFADSGTVVYHEREGQPGYLVNGHWRWGSGCRNAHWISGGIHEVDEAGERIERTEKPLNRVFFQPHEIEILDTWHVSGLRGSGSSDYVARDVWVPAHRLCTTIDHTPNATIPIYQFPRFGLLGVPIGAIALGMAQAAIDEVMTEAKTKTPQGSRRSLALRPALHKDIAVASTDVAAARSLFYQSIQEIWDAAQEHPETLEQRISLRTANVHALNTGVQVIDRMYTVMGGTSVYEQSCLQRHFRDVHVASQHMMVADSVMELAGRAMLGLDEQALGL